MKTDEKIKEEWMRLDAENLEKACEYLRRIESDVEDFLAEIVASICNIDVNEMFKNTSVAYIAQPRWLYWYAIRYATGETYEKIAARTQERGFAFSPNGIGQSINKMAKMIDSNPLWTKRWVMLKHIIKMRDTTNLSTQETVTFKVIAPKGYRLELKNE